MSGGSGGGGAPPPVDVTDCRIVEKTKLQSPDATVVSTLSIGDQLEVVVNHSGALARLEAVAKAGVAGGLTPRRLRGIVKCIEEHGWAYVAIVDALNGGDVDVTIRPYP